MKKWTRRALIVGGAIVAVPVAGIAAGKLWCRSNIMGAPKRRAAMLQDLYSPSSAAKGLGEHYLEQTRATAALSLQRLETNESLMQAAESGCRMSTMSVLEAACRDDFRQGRVRCVDGWVLSQTELDLAVLCSTG
jgi:hypothetical protein